MTVWIICIIVSLVVLALAALCGVLGGLRKGLLRSLVKLGALVLSVVLALIVTLCLRGFEADSLLKLLSPSVPADYRALVELAVQVPVAVALLIVFVLLFTVIRLLMLIPQHFISRMLPKTYDELIERRAKGNADSAPPVSSSPDEIAEEATPAPFVQAEEAADQPDQRAWKIGWKVAASLCGVLSSILLIGAYLMPISGLATSVGDSIYRIADVLAEENDTDYADEVSNYSRAVASAPLFTVTDFFYEKTVYEPLTTFKTEYGKINLSSELERATDVVCELLPVAIHLDREGDLAEGDVERLTAAVEQLADSRFILSLGTYALRTAGAELGNSDPEASAASQALDTALSAFLTDMTPDALSDDLRSAVDLVEALADSRLLKALTAEDAKLSLTDLADREVMRSLFGIFYDNERAKKLIVPLVNLATETALDSMGAEPVYSDADLSRVSRDEILEESERLCDAAEGLSKFVDSLEEEGSVYKLSGIGKALDCLRDSILFGDQYEALIESISAAGKSENADILLSSLGDRLYDIDSAERLLTSAEELMTLCNALERNEGKGSDDQALVASIDALLNDTAQEDIDILSEINGELYFADAEGVDSVIMQSELITDCLNTLEAVSDDPKTDAAAEADALQVLYDIAHDDTGNVFATVNEADTVDMLLNSSIALDMLSTLNADSRDYGISDKLTDENRSIIADALSESDASQAQKQLIADFFAEK